MSKKLVYAIIGGTVVTTGIVVPTVLFTMPREGEDKKDDFVEKLVNHWNNLGTNHILRVEGVSGVNGTRTTEIKDWESLVNCVKNTDKSLNVELKTFIDEVKKIKTNNKDFDIEANCWPKSNTSDSVIVKLTIGNKPSFFRETEEITLSGFNPKNKPDIIKNPNDMVTDLDSEIKKGSINNTFKVVNEETILNKNVFEAQNTDVQEFLFGSEGVLYGVTNAVTLKDMLKDTTELYEMSLSFSEPKIISNSDSQNISFKIKISKADQYSITESIFKINGFKSAVKQIKDDIDALNSTINLSNPIISGLDVLDKFNKLKDVDIANNTNDLLSYDVLFGEQGIFNNSTSSAIQKLKEIFKKAQNNNVLIFIKPNIDFSKNLYRDSNGSTSSSASVSFKFSIRFNSSNSEVIESKDNFIITNLNYINSQDISNRIDWLFSEAKKSNTTIYGKNPKEIELKAKNVDKDTLEWTNGFSAYSALFEGKDNGILNTNITDNYNPDPFNLSTKLKEFMKLHSKYFQYNISNLELITHGDQARNARFKIEVIELNKQTNSISSFDLILKGFAENVQSIVYQIQNLINQAQSYSSAKEDVYNIENNPNATNSIDLIIQPPPSQSDSINVSQTNWKNDQTNSYEALFGDNNNSTIRPRPNGVLKYSFYNEMIRRKNDPIYFVQNLENLMKENRQKFSFQFSEGNFNNSTSIASDFWQTKGTNYKKGFSFKIKVIKNNSLHSDFAADITKGKITLVQDKK